MVRIRQSTVHNVTSGENVVIYEPVNIYDCRLDDNVFVGPFVEIQGNTQIGTDSKIQSHTFICQYVTIGSRCFIGHGVMFANDMFREGKPCADHDSWVALRLATMSRSAAGRPFWQSLSAMAQLSVREAW